MPFSIPNLLHCTSLGRRQRLNLVALGIVEVSRESCPAPRTEVDSVTGRRRTGEAEPVLSGLEQEASAVTGEVSQRHRPLSIASRITKAACILGMIISA